MAENKSPTLAACDFGESEKPKLEVEAPVECELLLPGAKSKQAPKKKGKEGYDAEDQPKAPEKADKEAAEKNEKEAAPALSEEEAAKLAKRKEIEAKVKAAQAAQQRKKDEEAAAEMKRKEIAEKGPGHYGDHPGITCDGCGTVPIFGYRYHCKQCANHDICESCYDAWMGGKGTMKNGLAKQTLSTSAADHTFYLFKDKGFKSLAKVNDQVCGKVTKAPKPNEPCSCGSGAKYKKCCMNKQ